ncbi:MAG: ABC transporter permease [Caldilineaceae bacterium]|nr:ABC transporter permease [Caldilineaceae bacterium]
MRTIFTIALNDLTIFFRQRGNLIGLVVLPIALTLAVGWANSGDGNGPAYRLVDVVDLDQTAQSAALLATLQAANETLLLCPLGNDADDRCGLAARPLAQALAIERAQAEITSGALIIPQGYGDAVAQAQPIQLHYYSTEDPAFPGPVRQALARTLQEVNSAVVVARVGTSFLTILTPLLALDQTLPSSQAVERAVYQRAATQLATEPTLVRYTTTQASAPTISGVQSGFGQSVPGMGSLYVIFTVLGGTVTLLRERRQWTLQRLAALPLTRAQILGGKVLTYFTLGMLQFGVVFAVGLAVGVNFGQALIAMLAVMASFVLCMTALAILLATRVTSEGQANGLRNLLGLTLAPLGGAWWPLEIVPTFMQQIGHLSPVAWAMDGFHELIFNQGTLIDVLPAIGVLLVVAALLFGIGIQRFRVQ